MSDKIDSGVDLYSCMNLSPSATKVEIKKWFWLIALYTHPDKTAEAGSKEIFMQIETAYQLLLNPVTRKIYD